jgi:hypothetical protein
MFSVKYATTFPEGFYRTEDGCARGYNGPQLRQGSADSEVLNCRHQAIAQLCAFRSPKTGILSAIEIYRQLLHSERYGSLVTAGLCGNWQTA